MSNDGERFAGAQSAGFIGRYALVIIRLYLGAWMLLNGLNHFVEVFPQPMGGADKSSQLMVTLIETGLFGVVKSTEILVGVMLLLDLFVPVALVLAMPISVVVWFNHAVLGGHFVAFSMGIGCLVWNIVLLVAYLRYFVPMIRLRTHSAKLEDFGRIGGILKSQSRLSSQPESRDIPESRHRIPIALIGVVSTALLAYDLHPHVAQSPGAGMTPTTLVENYLKVARTGDPIEARKMYMSEELAGQGDSITDDQEGQPGTDRILQIVAQGSNVAVYHRIGEAGRSAIDVVDIYKISRSRISEHVRVAQADARPAVTPTAGLSEVAQ